MFDELSHNIFICIHWLALYSRFKTLIKNCKLSLVFCVEWHSAHKNNAYQLLYARNKTIDFESVSIHLNKVFNIFECVGWVHSSYSYSIVFLVPMYAHIFLIET